MVTSDTEVGTEPHTTGREVKDYAGVSLLSTTAQRAVTPAPRRHGRASPAGPTAPVAPGAARHGDTPPGTGSMSSRINGGTAMDISSTMTQIESAVANQIVLSGADESVESAAEALLNALEPAMRQTVLDLAEQAAAEVAAQLPGHRVDVVMSEGEPVLKVLLDESDPVAVDDDYEARISLRLPGKLKELIEESAGDTGDSVNSWVVKAVSSNVKVRKRSGGTRVTGTIDI